MDIYIKNMVCNRCIMVVSQIFDHAGMEVESIQLGKVKTKQEIEQYQLEHVNLQLKKVGFEIINDSKRRLIENIKTISIDYVYNSTEERKVNHRINTTMVVAKIDFTFTSISLSGSWIDFKRFSRDEIPSGNPI